MQASSHIEEHDEKHISPWAESRSSSATSPHSELITIALLLSFTFGCLDANLLVIFFQSCQIFTCLAEFPFFHTLSYIPMDKSTLAVHEVKFVIDAGENFCNGGRVANHATCAHDLSQITPM